MAFSRPGPTLRTEAPRSAGTTRSGVVMFVSGLVVLGGGALTLPRLLGGPDRATPAPSASDSAAPSQATTAAGLPADPRAAALAVGTRYLRGWEAGDWAAMASTLDSSDDMRHVYGEMATRLGIVKVAAVPGTPDAAGTTLPFDATLTLKDGRTVAYSTMLEIAGTTTPSAAGSGSAAPAPVEPGVHVHFTATSVYPGLKPGQRLDLIGTAVRRPLLDRAGQPLTTDPDLVANVIGQPPVAGTPGSGLQRALDSQLAVADQARAVGVVDVTTGKTVSVVVPAPSASPVTGLRTTLDLTVQRAGEQALAAATGTAALVAIDTQTGEVRALVNKPVTGLPPAIAGQYPPGSTFKVITATAALANGSTPQSTVPCTPTISVVGRVFHNHEPAPSRDLTMTEAFAESCNTAFIAIERSLPAGALASAAELFGFNAGPPLPIASQGGQIPAPVDGVESAADAIGQGRVAASPLQMASVAAGVASGTWHQPHLVDCPDCVTHALPTAAQLRPMMRAVVSSGTGTAARSVPGGPVYGKTGTAEYGSGASPPTHAWFIGWQGRTAFAVFVQDGSTGGAVAAPIAARFLKLLGGG